MLNFIQNHNEIVKSNKVITSLKTEKINLVFFVLC